jgi:hypothetical protein
MLIFNILYMLSMLLIMFSFSYNGAGGCHTGQFRQSPL